MTEPMFKAKCPGCGNTTFERAAGNDPKPDDDVTCTSCGRKVRYGDLRTQIEKHGRDLVEKGLRDMLKAFKRK